MIRVFVVAPTAAGRVGLRALAEGPGMEVVGDGPAPDGAPADVDVLVLAGPAPVAAGLRALDRARARAVVAVTDDARTAGALRGLDLRGWAIVSPDASGAELRAALAAAAQGFTVLPAALAGRLPGPGEGLDGAAEPLTPREREVLELLGQGLTNRRIAERLGISEHTAKFHVAAVCGKLGAATRTEAVSRGVRRGLITL